MYMILMGKINKILICILLLVYIIALAVFHTTYEYTTYWEEESPIIIRYSVCYIVIGIILYMVVNWKNLKPRVSNITITIKVATQIAAYASLLRAFLIIMPLLVSGFFYSLYPIIETLVWIVISVFFFTLHKNMK